MSMMILMLIMSTTLKTLHPMNYLILLLIISIMCSMMLFFKTIQYWLMLLIFMTFIGGLMIIFLYIISLTPNEEEHSIKMNLPMMTIILLMNLNLNHINSSKTNSNMYIMNYPALFIMFTLIFLMVLLSTKLIMMPFKSMKSTH